MPCFKYVLKISFLKFNSRFQFEGERTDIKRYETLTRKKGVFITQKMEVSSCSLGGDIVAVKYSKLFDSKLHPLLNLV